MALKELNIKRSYDSYTSNLAEEFFAPALGETILYKRAAAYFSSTSFQAISKGLSHLIAKGGAMQLIVSVVITEADYNAILQGKKGIVSIIDGIFGDEELLFDMINNDSVNALCQLVASGKLEIKFLISKRGIFHMKFGILEDAFGNQISFSGSLNETLAGYKQNGEEFKVFRSWISGEDEYVKIDLEKFDMYWQNKIQSDDVLIADMPEDAKRHMAEAASKGKKLGTSPKLSLRPYQENAIKFFTGHDYKGIFEMATGTGKTIVAMQCAKNIYNKFGSIFTIIAVPTNALAVQWKESWKKFFGTIPLILKPGKIASLAQYCKYLGNKAVIIMTYASLAKQYIKEIILSNNLSNIMLIADEVHWLGAKSNSNAMQLPFKFRIGLSATPERMFDEDGTEKLLRFFGNNEFIYSISEAIVDGYLSKFNYFPSFCNLNDNEIKKYAALTKKVLSSHFHNEDGQKPPNEIALMQRARIAKKAKSKIAAFMAIIKNLKSIGKLNHLLVFFDDHEQLRAAQSQIFGMGIPFSIIDGETGEKERADISQKLGSGEISCIFAIKVMDEGVDIPSAKREIIMASSTNERQYIQRAGRILRLYRADEVADIYDAIAYCEPKDCPDWLWKYEAEAIKKEIKRAMHFCCASINKAQCLSELYEFSKKINIPIWQ